MAKFRIRLKLQGLDLEVDGERQDLPAITHAVQQQLTNLVVSGEVITDGSQRQLADGSNNGTGGGEDEEPRKRRPVRRAARGVGDGVASAPIDFRHDGAKYGNPVQAWSLTEKLIWLLYVLKKTASMDEVAGPQLASTFNQNFKQAGKIHPPHVTMHLGRAKMQNPPPIGQDKDNYFLTNEGDKQAEQLIQNLLNPAQ
jgi:hypothetical protein